MLIALQDGGGRGSGRSIPGFHLYDALDACADLLVEFGGHRYAAGLSIDEETLERFVERFEEVSAGLLSADDLIPVLSVDAELSPHEVTAGLADPKDDTGTWAAVEIEPGAKFPHAVSLAQIKAEKTLEECELLRQSRLSVAEIRPAEWKKICAMAKG